MILSDSLRNWRSTATPATERDSLQVGDVDRANDKCWAICSCIYITQPVTTYQSHNDLVKPLNWFKSNLSKFFSILRYYISFWQHDAPAGWRRRRRRRRRRGWRLSVRVFLTPVYLEINQSARITSLSCRWVSQGQQLFFYNSQVLALHSISPEILNSTDLGQDQSWTVE